MAGYLIFYSPFPLLMRPEAERAVAEAQFPCPVTQYSHWLRLSQIFDFDHFRRPKSIDHPSQGRTIVERQHLSGRRFVI